MRYIYFISYVCGNPFANGMCEGFTDEPITRIGQLADLARMIRAGNEWMRQDPIITSFQLLRMEDAS